MNCTEIEPECPPPKILPTFGAHVRRGYPDISQATLSVQIHHDLWSHRFGAAASAATGVVYHIPLRLEVHHSSDSQFMLHLYCHVLHLSRTAAEPDTGQHPEGHKHINNTLFLGDSDTFNPIRKIHAMTEL